MQAMVMTKTNIGEISSFLLAKRVVLQATVFFTFNRFFDWKKAAKEIYSKFCSVENNDARAVSN